MTLGTPLGDVALGDEIQSTAQSGRERKFVVKPEQEKKEATSAPRVIVVRRKE